MFSDKTVQKSGGLDNMTSSRSNMCQLSSFDSDYAGGLPVGECVPSYQRQVEAVSGHSGCRMAAEVPGVEAIIPVLV